LAHGPADRRVAVLREIGAAGSISQAARAVGVSYKAAWQAVDTLTNLAGTPLVERVVGGAGGGGARLTGAGQALLRAADALAQARAGVLAAVAPEGGGAVGSAAARVRAQAQAQAVRPAAALALRTSMRNQWPCVVDALETDGAVTRVRLRGPAPAEAPARGAEPAGMHLAARITRESSELLGLRPGNAVLALCKATAVRVWAMPAGQATGRGHSPPPDANTWTARAVRVSRGGAQGDEVVADLDAGVRMVGFAPEGSGLRAGRRVALAVDESAVVLAVVEAG
jgi:molybdate transport system regulatory protein